MSKFSLHIRLRDTRRALRHCEARSSLYNQLKPWIASSFLLAMTRSVSRSQKIKQLNFKHSLNSQLLTLNS